MRILLFLFLCLNLSFADLKDEIKDSVVRLSVHYQKPVYYYPWRWHSPARRSCQGLVVSKRHVIVQASMVLNAALIEMRLNTEPIPTTMKVAFIDFDRNIALLEGELPPSAKVIKIPKVSQYDMSAKVRYFWKTKTGRFLEGTANLDRVESLTPLSSFQAQLWVSGSNASMRGGFGEPVFLNGTLIGIGSYHNNNTSISIIPNEVIHKSISFESLKRAKQTSMPGFLTVPCTQKYLREQKGLEGIHGGCFVTEVFGQGSGSKSLKNGDILLSIAGKPLDAWGRYEHPKFGLLTYEHLFSDFELSSKLPIEIMRDKKKTKLDLDLSIVKDEAWLIPRYRNGEPSLYFIRGGFLFQNLCFPYLRAWGNDWKNKVPEDVMKIFEENKYVKKSEERQNIVILSQVLAHPINRGLQYIGRKIVSEVNGKKLRGLNHLKEIMDSDTSDLIHITLATGKIPLLVSAKELKSVDEKIRNMYGIDKLERLDY